MSVTELLSACHSPHLFLGSKTRITFYMFLQDIHVFFLKNVPQGSPVSAKVLTLSCKHVWDLCFVLCNPSYDDGCWNLGAESPSETKENNICYNKSHQWLKDSAINFMRICIFPPFPSFPSPFPFPREHPKHFHQHRPSSRCVLQPET